MCYQKLNNTALKKPDAWNHEQIHRAAQARGGAVIW